MTAVTTDSERTIRERGILMSAPMVRRTLADAKWMTRRVMNPQPVSDSSAWAVYWRGPNRNGEYGPSAWGLNDPVDASVLLHCPHGAAGDRLWVRETWAPFHDPELFTCVKFQADGARMQPTRWTPEQGGWCEAQSEYDRWRPSIHMPRWASRLTLEITEVRAERLQSISEKDALAEGIESDEGHDDLTGETYPLFGLSDGKHRLWHQTAREAFRELWDELNAARGFGWAINPWVWVLTFRRIAEKTAQEIAETAEKNRANATSAIPAASCPNHGDRVSS